LLFSVLAILFAVVVHGHQGIPQSQTLFIEGNRLVVPARYWGMFVGSTSGPWRWICDEAMSSDATPNPNRSWARTGSGVYLASDFHGVLSSRDGGCTWEAAPGEIAARPTAAVAADPIDPHSAWAVTYASTPTNALYLSGDDGKSFAPVFTADANLNGVALSPDAQRIWLSGSRRGTNAPVLWLSTDWGRSFQQLNVTYQIDGMVPTTLRVLAVDPRDPTHAWLAASRESARSLVESDGTTFSERLRTTGDIFSIAFDASTTWAATQAGLYRGAPGASLTPKGDLSQAYCVILDGATVWACSSNYTPDFKVLARSDDGGDHFTGVFKFDQTVGPADCPAGTPVATICPPQWELYSERLDVPRPDLGGGPPPPPSGCSVGQLGRRL
jgi:hypothetical protein